jgi:hypothetical protein
MNGMSRFFVGLGLVVMLGFLVVELMPGLQETKEGEALIKGREASQDSGIYESQLLRNVDLSNAPVTECGLDKNRLYNFTAQGQVYTQVKEEWGIGEHDAEEGGNGDISDILNLPYDKEVTTYKGEKGKEFRSYKKIWAILVQGFPAKFRGVATKIKPDEKGCVVIHSNKPGAVMILGKPIPPKIWGNVAIKFNPA